MNGDRSAAGAAGGGDLPLVSVVVLAFNGRDHLKLCLPTLLTQTYPADRLELLVVDNASSDGSYDYVRQTFPAIRVVRNPHNYGFARGNNIGARVARGEFVAFLNQDTRVNSTWVAELVAPILAARRRGDRDLVCTGSKMVSWGGEVIDFAGGRMNFIGKGSQLGFGLPDDGRYDVERQILFACGGALLIEREIFLVCGGFDEDYFVFFEDVDLGWRLWVLGYRVQLAPRAVTYHRLHASTGELQDVHRQLIFERNALFSILKNYDDANLVRVLPASLLLTIHHVLTELREDGLKAEAFDIRNRDRLKPTGITLRSSSAALLLALQEILDRMPTLLAKRQAVQSRRRRPDHEIVTLFGGPLEPLSLVPGHVDLSFTLAEALGVRDVFAHVARHVLVITPDVLPLPGLPATGAGLRAWGLGQGLAARGHRVTYSMHENTLKIGGGDLPDALRTVAWTEKTLSEVIARVNPDAVVLCGWYPAVWLDPARVPVRLPVIIDQHGPHLIERSYHQHHIIDLPLGVQQKIDALAKADFFTCAGERQKHYFEPWLMQAGFDLTRAEERPAVVPLALAPDLPDHAPAGEVTFVYGGVFLPWQDPTASLTTLVETLEQRQAGRLTIFGGAHPLFPEVGTGVFPHLRLALEASPRVTLEPLIPHAELLRRYAGAHVAIDLMQRNAERELAFTTRTVEYLWCGLPVIYNDYSELSDYIRDHEAGWTLDPADREGLRAVIEAILRDPALAAERGRNARRLVREHLTWDKAIEALDRFVRRPRLRQKRRLMPAPAVLPGVMAGATTATAPATTAGATPPPRPEPSAYGATVSGAALEAAPEPHATPPPVPATEPAPPAAPAAPAALAAQRPGRPAPPPRPATLTGDASMSIWMPERLSVVVPTYNRPDLLARALEGLEAQTWPRARFEVIVVDDGSAAPVGPVVEAAAGRGLPVVLERQANAGPAAARNRGTRRASGDVVAYLDDDCVPAPSWLEEHALGHTRRGLATIGRTEWHPEIEQTPLLRFASERFLFRFDLVGIPEDAPFSVFYTANGAVDRELAASVGLFDELYPRAAWEDTEFAYRLRQAGGRFVYRPAAIVYHLRGLDLAGFLRRERAAGHEAVRTWTKHPELRGMTGVDGVVGEAVEFSFFESAGQYAWLIGAADALGPGGANDGALATLARELLTEPDLARWRDDYVRDRERQARTELTRRQKSIETLHGQVDRLTKKIKELEEELNVERRDHAQLNLAYQAQDRWAREMETRLHLLSNGNVVDKVVSRIRPGKA